jgi:uncharacterized membrane protein
MNDRQIQNALAGLMLVGVIAAAAVMLAGLLWFLSAHPDSILGDHVFQGQPKYLTDPLTMLRQAFDSNAVGERRSVIMLGVVLLLINPVLRVGVAALGFLAEKDWLYTGVSLMVFAVLLFSFFS